MQNWLKHHHPPQINHHEEMEMSEIGSGPTEAKSYDMKHIPFHEQNYRRQENKLYSNDRQDHDIEDYEDTAFR